MSSNQSSSGRNGIGAGTVVRRKADSSFECITDEVAVEEPLEIRIGGRPLVMTMRTPGNDQELAAGFLVSEGIIRDREDICAVETVANSNGNAVQVQLGSHVKFDPGAISRFGSISTSCGLCGNTSIDSIRQQFPTLRAVMRPRIALAAILQLPERLREAQGNFARTGGIHAAGVFDSNGELMVVREDVGRHNAVDKAIGWALLHGCLPLSDHILLVSGRTSLEITQKALAAGIPIVASVSAPSSLAVQFAREVRQTLVGFLRPPTFNVYAHIERLALSA